ncbi:MAG: alpha/beta-hydrolase family protein, partial [Wenzhouxiangella sp.]|nr:alpha/beta-hydrolase family protein [Wenzhouxiangella sp.]
LLAGLSFAAGYGLGVAAVWAWRYLELPLASRRWTTRIQVGAGALCLAVAISFLWRATTWQNNLRELMGMEDSHAGQRWLMALIALLVFVLVLALARLFRWVFRRLSRRLNRHVPVRVSHIVSAVLAVLLFWSVVDGVLVSSVLRVADRSFQQLDALIDDDLPRPSAAEQTGSAASLLDWEELGRQGRSFVSTGPTDAEISAFFDAPVPRPLRVYVGLNSADSPEARARLALDELKRVGGFERQTLLLVTPTGTGWVDPAAQDTVEYLLRGDVASVAVQYSYLNSPLALLTQAAYGAETARAVFNEIYGYWRGLPAETRPRLYLWGLSLGSLNSDRSFDLFDIIDAPFSGALWSGPPFRHRTWQGVTAQRDADSPAWLPTFRSGAVVRFMNQYVDPDRHAGDWGQFRMVFLQHGSDPIVFFSPGSAWREPAWMQAPRAPDVSPDLRWFPIVTMLQLAADMMVGTAPPGFGHEYAPADYLAAWHALMEPSGWTEAGLARLEQHLASGD